MDLGRTISKIRKDRGIPQGELAERTELSVTYISQIENNRKRPNITTLESISDVLEIPLPVIFFLSLDESDIPSNKKEAYSTLFPSVEQFIRNFFLTSAK